MLFYSWLSYVSKEEHTSVTGSFVATIGEATDAVIEAPVVAQDVVQTLCQHLFELGA